MKNVKILLVVDKRLNLHLQDMEEGSTIAIENTKSKPARVINARFVMGEPITVGKTKAGYNLNVKAAQNLSLTQVRARVNGIQKPDSNGQGLVISGRFTPYESQELDRVCTAQDIKRSVFVANAVRVALDLPVKL